MTFPSVLAKLENRNLDGPCEREGGMAMISLGRLSGYAAIRSAGEAKNCTFLLVS
jgi:hypothetical protein